MPLLGDGNGCDDRGRLMDESKRGIRILPQQFWRGDEPRKRVKPDGFSRHGVCTEAASAADPAGYPGVGQMRTRFGDQLLQGAAAARDGGTNGSIGETRAPNPDVADTFCAS